MSTIIIIPLHCIMTKQNENKHKNYSQQQQQQQQPYNNS